MQTNYLPSPSDHSDSRNKDSVPCLTLLGNLVQICERTRVRVSIHHHPCLILSLASHIQIALLYVSTGMLHLCITKLEKWEQEFLWLTSQKLHGINVYKESCVFEKCYYLNMKQNGLISSVSYVASSFYILVSYVWFMVIKYVAK